MIEKYNHDKLVELRTAIKNHHEEATAHAGKIREIAGSAILEYLLCGKALIEAKKLVEYSKWQIWIAENCPKISADTCENYIAASKFFAKLSESERARILDSPISLRQILRLARGEPAATESQPSPTFRFPTLPNASRLPAIETWTPEDRVRFVERVEPLIELCRVAKAMIEAKEVGV